MIDRTPLANLILRRMSELGLDHEALGRRLGYVTTAKAAGRVYAMLDGNVPLSSKSRHALQRLSEALEIDPSLVTTAVAQTDEKAASDALKAEEKRQRAQEEAEASWRAAFVPHAVLHTARTTPTQITMCGVTGGARRWLMVPLDVSQPPITFIGQALAALPTRTRLGPTGLRGVWFFGRVLGIVVNFTLDHAVRFDLEGMPLEVLPTAYRPGEVILSLGGRLIEPAVMARVLGIKEAGVPDNDRERREDE